MPKAPAKNPILLAAGGTGGHLFPAQALADVLIQRGKSVALVTDKRAEGWAEHFPGDVHTIIAGTVTGASIETKLAGIWRLLKGIVQAYRLLGQVRPSLVVGFGGYPTVPPILAAKLRGIPTMIHEGNAVMGRANRFLAPRVNRIATGFPLKGDAFPEKTVVTGNPIRKPVLHAAGTAYPPLSESSIIRLLVFGGSQGARVMSDVVPNALQHVAEDLRKRLHVTQQARDEDVLRVTKIYEKLGVHHNVQHFFEDLPKRMAESHLVIGRAGASTVAELGIIGRPAILVPLPGALDQDQAANGEVLEAAGGAVILAQNTAFTPVSLAELLERLLADPLRLQKMAASAKSIGVPDAPSRLADEVLSILSGG
ncbi:MAG: undecaprenyldiphospho-muramoylpentapeptide beta-N-acetylglucosaminyltransferase [Proteobacteria bacterium]|nr:undecaprenyldiphospho-muramoylpentapeptide beta-N-acetylglucosaminyltransferase [Pseudomonadota bacterium]